MERVCPKCESLVEGTGVFCPVCGERLESAVNLNKVAMPSASRQAAEIFPNSSAANDPNSRKAQMPDYPQSYNSLNTPSASTNELSVGEWVLTIFLSTWLGFISIILLILWAFGTETNNVRKNYARAMLIFYIITVMFASVVGVAACSFGMFNEIINDINI